MPFNLPCGGSQNRKVLDSITSHPLKDTRWDAIDLPYTLSGQAPCAGGPYKYAIRPKFRIQLILMHMPFGVISIALQPDCKIGCMGCGASGFFTEGCQTHFTYAEMRTNLQHLKFYEIVRIMFSFVLSKRTQVQSAATGKTF